VFRSFFVMIRGRKKRTNIPSSEGKEARMKTVWLKKKEDRQTYSSSSVRGGGGRNERFSMAVSAHGLSNLSIQMTKKEVEKAYLDALYCT